MSQKLYKQHESNFSNRSYFLAIGLAFVGGIYAIANGGASDLKEETLQTKITYVMQQIPEFKAFQKIDQTILKDFIIKDPTLAKVCYDIYRQVEQNTIIPQELINSDKFYPSHTQFFQEQTIKAHLPYETAKGQASVISSHLWDIVDYFRKNPPIQTIQKSGIGTGCHP